MPTVTSRSWPPRGREREVGGAAERGGVAHGPVGVQREHFGLGIAAPRFPRGPDERRRGGGGARLDQDVLGRKLEPLLESRGQPGAGDDEYPLARDQAGETIHRFLRARAGAGEREQLLGILRRAERPEPGAGAAGEEDGPPHQRLTGAPPGPGRAAGGRRARADIALRSREDREPVGAAGPREHQRTAREVEHRRSELAPARAFAEPAGVLGERRGQGRHGLGLEAGAGVLDRQAVAAQQQRSLHPVARRETAQHIGETGHSWHSVSREEKVRQRRRSRGAKSRNHARLTRLVSALNLPVLCRESATCHSSSR